MNDPSEQDSTANETEADDFGDRVFQQVLDLWVTPALAKRQAAGELKDGTRIAAIQVIFFPDNRPIEVRINNEVKVLLTVPDASFTLGQPVYSRDIKAVSDVRLVDEERDCGHVTILLLPAGSQLFFDFRKNLAASQAHVDAAKQFHAAAQLALDAGHLRPFVDNLFSASELAAKAFLLGNADPTFRPRTTHDTIRARFNRMAKPGQVHSDKTRTFNTLEGLRRRGRYLDGPFDVEFARAREMLAEIGELIGTLDRSIA
jgi:hypothetical protein